MEGAGIDVAAFEHLFESRLSDPSIRICKALEANFDTPQGAAERRIAEAIAEYRRLRASALQTELFTQKKRLADAERTPQSKTTKSAQESQRIASRKIKQLTRQLNDLERTSAGDDDARIYPLYYAPVVIQEGGERVIRPMRYHCRPAGRPALYDRKYPGLYNARRDNLERFWKGQFGHTHAIAVFWMFFENVARHDFEHRALRPGEAESNVVLAFDPRPAFPMKVACLWSHWEGKGESAFDSFAAITDEPPPEVAAAGHNRCVIPLKDRHLDAWLNPASADPASLYAILDDRERPYYEHRLAA
jgi:putative SOS response-associated peptidase YedK